MKITLVLLSLFSIAMGYLESSVVVYLRELYYPSGFTFPLTLASGRIGATEVFREASTMLMLFTVAWLAGKNFVQRFAFFIFSFALWDIFYYVFLRILIHWPESVLTWDVLFLIPLLWSGPVAAPVIVSVTLLILSGIILYFDNRCLLTLIGWLPTMLVIGGFILIFVSMIWDFSGFFLKEHPFSAFFQADLVRQVTRKYVPSFFNWYLFAGGELVLLAGIYFFYAGCRKSGNPG